MKKTKFIIHNKWGETHIQVKELKTNKISNKVDLKVVKISSIDLDKDEIELKERSKTKIPLSCYDQYGKKLTDPYLTYISNDVEIAETILQVLLLKRQGKTEITAMTHDCESNTLKVNVVYNDDKEKTGGFPEIRYSGIHTDPRLPDSDNVVMLRRCLRLSKNIWRRRWYMVGKSSIAYCK